MINGFIDIGFVWNCCEHYAFGFHQGIEAFCAIEGMSKQRLRVGNWNFRIMLAIDDQNGAIYILTYRQCCCCDQIFKCTYLNPR